MKARNSSERGRKNVYSFLSEEIDPQSDSFWPALLQTLEHTSISSNIKLDRRAIINLKLILSSERLNSIKIQALTLLLLKIGINLPLDFAQDIGDVFLQLMFRDKGEQENEAIEYSTALRQLCNNVPEMKKTIFDKTIDVFARWLYDPFDLSNRIISEIFLLNITLISGKSSIRHDFKKHIFLVHISGASKLLQSSNDSIAQITIAEWIWRSIRLIDSSQTDIENALDKMSGIIDVPKDHFRAHLHDFIQSINGEASEESVIIHIPFDSMTLSDEVQINCRGCIDVNQDNIALFFNDKVNSIPDVVIFRSKFITQASKIGKDEISFTTREKTQAFKSVIKEAPSELKFHPESSIHSSTRIKEFIRRLKQPKVLRTSKNVNPGKNIQTKRTVAPKSSKKINKKLSTSTRNDARVSYNEEESDIEEQEEKTKKEHKTIELSEIEARLNECSLKSEQKIIQSYDSCIHKVKEVSNELSGMQSALEILLSQHNDITNCTINENKSLGSSVTNLQTDFEVRHNDTASKREGVKKKAIDGIAQDKKEILEKATQTFRTNAITAFTSAIDNIQQDLQMISV